MMVMSFKLWGQWALDKLTLRAKVEAPQCPACLLRRRSGARNLSVKRHSNVEIPTSTSTATFTTLTTTATLTTWTLAGSNDPEDTLNIFAQDNKYLFFRWKILSCHSWHWRVSQGGFARPMPVVISFPYRIAAVLCPPESVIQTRRVSYKLFVPVSVGCGWFSSEPARFYGPWLKKQSADQWVSLLNTDYGP